MDLNRLPYNLGQSARSQILQTIFPTLSVLFFSLTTYLNEPYVMNEIKMPHSNAKFDFIVVGSGAGGSVVAGRLSEVKSETVLVLESGGLPTETSYLPGLTALAQFSEQMWYPPMETQKYCCSAYKNNTSLMPLGHVLGGGTSTNLMIYTRGDATEFNHWASLGNPGWDYESVLPYLKKMENYQGKTTQETDHLRGKDGPLKITKKPISTQFQKTLRDALREIGLNVIDYNADSQIGFNAPDHFLYNGLRQSVAENYLKPNLRKGNLKVLSEAHVTKIIINEERKAIGVKYMYKGKERTAFARKEVILSAGALNTPKILMLSGVGPKEELDKFQIPVIADIPGVGQNFHDHVGMFGGLVWLRGRLRGQELLDLFNPYSYLQYTTFNKGPLSEPFALEMTGFQSVEGDPNIADIQFDCFSASIVADGGFILYELSGYDEEFFLDMYEEILGERTFSCSTILMRPKSRGYVTLKSLDPFEHPKFSPEYLSHPDDVRILRKGLQFVKQFGDTKAMKKKNVKLFDKPTIGCEHLNQDSDEYWDCFARVHSRTYYHPVGSCKMAPESDPMGVVDPQLRLRNIKNLRIVDGSVMPTVTPGNTEVPIIMIAEKAADMIKEDWKLLS